MGVRLFDWLVCIADTPSIKSDETIIFGKDYNKSKNLLNKNQSNQNKDKNYQRNEKNVSGYFENKTKNKKELNNVNNNNHNNLEIAATSSQQDASTPQPQVTTQCGLVLSYS